MHVKNIIVGAGLSGSILARRIAEESDEQVLLIEKKQHIAGTAYDCYDQHGLLVHLYGPHIFRTNDEQVWHYLSRFTDWIQYYHRVLAYVDGKLLPMPINLDTINLLYGTSFNSFSVADFFEKAKDLTISAPANMAEHIIQQVGRDLYEKFFKNYTSKQWGMDATELPPEVVARLPIRTSRDDRYFTHRFQGIPKHGYTAMVKRILDHPKIKLLLNTDFAEIQDELTFDRLFYTGCIDEYFGYRFGHLPYRSLNFVFETVEQEIYQPVATVNFPNEYEYTRITEFKHFTGQKSALTTICKEYPTGRGEPYYPIPGESNQALYRKYSELASGLPHVFFLGRLGRYRYYSMDQVVHDALSFEFHDDSKECVIPQALHGTRQIG